VNAVGVWWGKGRIVSGQSRVKDDVAGHSLLGLRGAGWRIVGPSTLEVLVVTWGFL
jgi:hypothetical protein